jgi:anti-anti-sigma factor
MNETNSHTLPKVERNGNLTILTFTSDAIRDVENVVARELSGLKPGVEDYHLLLNFANVKILNSLELGTLISLNKQVRSIGGRLTLFNLDPRVLELFTMCRLDELLTICREEFEPGITDIVKL